MKGPNGEVREVPSASIDYAVRDGWSRLPQVLMRKPDGEVTSVDADLAEAAEHMGYWRMTEAEIADVAAEKKAAAEWARPGYLEEPEALGSVSHEREVRWETDPSRIASLLRT
jgi:hypothetical protein